MQSIQTIIDAGGITRDDVLALARETVKGEAWDKLFTKLQAATGFQEPTLALFIDDETTDEEILVAEVYEGEESLD